MKLAASVVSVLCLVATLGCGPGSEFDLVPVSGTIKMDGKPLPGVQVNFFPQSRGDTSLVGPYSNAITDEQGSFTLKSRYGHAGAVVGEHQVSVKYEGVDMEDVAAQEIELREMIEDAKDIGGDKEAFEAELAEEKKLLAELKKQASASGVFIPARYSFNSELRFKVPEGGTDSADFDLSSKR